MKNSRSLTLHDLEFFVIARPIVIIEHDNKYWIGKVDKVDFVEGKPLNLHLQDLLDIRPMKEGRWNWVPVPSSLQKDLTIVLPDPQVIDFGDSLTLKSNGNKVTLSLRGSDVVNYESLTQRYLKL